MKSLTVAALLWLAPAASFAAETPASASQAFESQLKGMEREFVPLVEAMPAARFDFAPTEGAFQNVRTFGLQAKHVAFVLNEVAAGILGEKNPSTTAPHENGPAGLKSKEEIVQYVKDAFAYTHKAFGSLTNGNLLGEIKDPFGSDRKISRAAAATIILWHSFDHYGQMVVYARMNGVVPPASR